jgi:hypothetical protein
MRICPSFIHVHSHTQGGDPHASAIRDETESVLIERLVTDLLVWIDSAWIIGLVRPRGVSDFIDVIGVFSSAGDSASWFAYREAISICARAEALSCVDSDLRRGDLVQLLFPVETDGQVAAMVAIGPRNKHGRYSASDLSVMRNLCAQIASLLRAPKAQMNNGDDPDVVHAIQDRLAPSNPASFPHVSGIECAAQCERSGRLGGDFFDLSGSNSAGLTAAIGNVAVAGNPGCILMTGLQACLRSLGRHGVELPDLFGEMNRMFWEIAPENTHASLFSGRVSAGRERLHYINAGHQPALIVRRDGRVERLEPNAPALGLSRSGAYRQRTVPFGPGDTLIALSDGVTEAAVPVNIAECERALVEMVLRERGARIRELPARILNLVDALAGPHILDRTIVVVHFKDVRVKDVDYEEAATEPRMLARAVSAAA